MHLAPTDFPPIHRWPTADYDIKAAYTAAKPIAKDLASRGFECRYTFSGDTEYLELRPLPPQEVVVHALADAE